VIVVAEVLDARFGDAHAPMVYHDREFRTLADDPRGAE
jgi:hypothetical protein